jgi:hypothetical protein
VSELTGFNQCDRCAAKAYIRVELFSGLDLVFCGHHYTEHREALEGATLRVENQLQELIDSCP